jgi:hypothetical protein
MSSVNGAPPPPPQSGGSPVIVSLENLRSGAALHPSYFTYISTTSYSYSCVAHLVLMP